MTRNFVLMEILEVLKTWESCAMEKKTANDILTRLEDIGIIVPPERVIGICVDESTGELMKVHGFEWENNKKEENQIKYIVKSS